MSPIRSIGSPVIYVEGIVPVNINTGPIERMLKPACKVTTTHKLPVRKNTADIINPKKVACMAFIANCIIITSLSDISRGTLVTCRKPNMKADMIAPISAEFLLPSIRKASANPQERTPRKKPSSNNPVTTHNAIKSTILLIETKVGTTNTGDPASDTSPSIPKTATIPTNKPLASSNAVTNKKFRL